MIDLRTILNVGAPALAFTALSVTLTGLSGLLAIAAIPLLSGLLERVLHELLRVEAPIPLLALVFTIEAERVAAMLGDVVLLAAVFVSASFGAGWVAGTMVWASDSDRFTLSAEFATRNIAIATAIAVTMLGRTEFAVFGSVYFVTELPPMLAAAAVWRRQQPSPASPA